MAKVKRFGVSLEDDLLKELDALAKAHKFPNRSQAVRSLIRNSIVAQNWEENKEVAGCLVIVYDHHKRDLMNKSVVLQHAYEELVLSVQHVHLDHHNCLEMVALKGKASKLKELADKLIALKGIKHGQLVMSSIGRIK
ncbi:MAG: nickel-responsive transcriptional regulator NikR [Candidatus Omnitrophica bacterium]|nr:nickel-responsive transcriptional regulator NikR [Candidatus Omnitrophota bacterium]